MEEITFKVGDKVYLASYETISATTQVDPKDYFNIQAKEPLTITQIITNPHTAIMIAEFPTSMFAIQWLSKVPCNSLKPSADTSPSIDTSREEYNKHLVDRIKQLRAATSHIRPKPQEEIKPKTFPSIAPTLPYIDHPRTLIEQTEWEQYSALLKEFYLTHSKDEQPPIMRGTLGYYSVMKPMSNEKMQELNKERGWDYSENLQTDSSPKHKPGF